MTSCHFYMLAGGCKCGLPGFKVVNRRHAPSPQSSARTSAVSMRLTPLSTSALYASRFSARFASDDRSLPQYPAPLQDHCSQGCAGSSGRQRQAVRRRNGCHAPKCHACILGGNQRVSPERSPHDQAPTPMGETSRPAETLTEAALRGRVLSLKAEMFSQVPQLLYSQLPGGCAQRSRMYGTHQTCRARCDHCCGPRRRPLPLLPQGFPLRRARRARRTPTPGTAAAP